MKRALMNLLTYAAPAVLAGVATLGALHAQDGAITVMRRADLDKGASEKIDLEALRKEYARFKASFAAVVDKSTTASLAMLDEGYDSGLPACRVRQTREEALGAALPERFAGQKLAFVSFKSGRIELTKEIADDPLAGVLVVKATKLRGLADASRAIHRSVSVGTKELAGSVGVTCYPSWVEVKPNRREVVIHEGE